TERSSYSTNETVNLLGYVRGKSGHMPSTLTLTLPNGRREEIGTARGDGRHADFTAAYRAGAPGEYIASIPGSGSRSAPISCVFTVAPGHEEDLNRSSDPDLMRQLAAAGGGVAMTLADVEGFPERLPAREAARTKNPTPRTAWDRPWVLAVLLTALGAEWWLRRRAGLA